jgi:phosphoribosylanthranilate isomerase
MTDTLIKVCGLRDATCVDAAVKAGANFIGFVHWEGSPRAVSAQHACTLARSLPEEVQPVGLFVNADLDTVLRCPFKVVQLHGDEDVAFCETVHAEGKCVIRGFQFDIDAIKRWDACTSIDRLLVDGSAVGGEGMGFDHNVLAELIAMLRTPVILAGGLTPLNVADAITRTQPWAVDVSSGVERSRGEKDPALIEAFCRAARAA